MQTVNKASSDLDSFPEEWDCVRVLVREMNLDKDKVYFNTPNDPPDFIYDQIIGIEHTRLNYNVQISPAGVEKSYGRVMLILREFNPKWAIYPCSGISSSKIEKTLRKILAFLQINSWDLSKLKENNMHVRPDISQYDKSNSGYIIISDAKNSLFLRYFLDISYSSLTPSGVQSADILENIRRAVYDAIATKTYKIHKKNPDLERYWLLLEDTEYQRMDMVNYEEWLSITKNLEKDIFERIFVVSRYTNFCIEL